MRLRNILMDFVSDLLGIQYILHLRLGKGDSPDY
jgi:hypothetical protein